MKKIQGLQASPSSSESEEAKGEESSEGIYPPRRRRPFNGQKASRRLILSLDPISKREYFSHKV